MREKESKNTKNTINPKPLDENTEIIDDMTKLAGTVETLALLKMTKELSKK